MWLPHVHRQLRKGCWSDGVAEAAALGCMGMLLLLGLHLLLDAKPSLVSCQGPKEVADWVDGGLAVHRAAHCYACAAVSLFPIYNKSRAYLNKVLGVLSNDAVQQQNSADYHLDLGV